MRGQRVPIIGRISMDVTTVDLTAVPGGPRGRRGDAHRAATARRRSRVDEVAARCGTISYEILTGLTPRLPRVYHDTEPAAGG